MRRVREIAVNLTLLARTAARHTRDDPLLLLVQTARRLPRGTRRGVSALVGLGARGEGVRGALAAYVADRPDVAAERLTARPARTRPGRRLAAELAVQLGRVDAVPGGLEAAGTLTRARAARERGDISGAAHLAGRARAETPERARLVSERATMETGFRLSAPSGAWSRPDGTPERRALHVLTNSLPHTRSGYTIRSHAVLAGQQRAGIAVAALTRPGYPVAVGLPLARHEDIVEGIVYHRLLPTRPAAIPTDRLQQAVDAVLHHVDRFRPTVLHTTTDFPNALVTEAVARATGLPWVYEVRGQLEKTWLASRPDAERTAAKGSERYRLAAAKEMEMVLAADHVVTINETLRDVFLAGGVDAARITVVPHAVDERAAGDAVPAAVARRRLGLPADGFWVGSVSSLVDYEGLDTLLHAVALLRRRGLDARAAVVGDGVSRPALLDLAEQLGLGGAAVLPGRVDRAEAALWHRALDVFAVPRRDLAVCRTVTPLKPLEAMAAGRPVLASDLPALEEIVARPGAGLLVPPGDAAALAGAVATVATDANLSNMLGAAGRAFAARRTWWSNGRTYREIYEKLGT